MATKFNPFTGLPDYVDSAIGGTVIGGTPGSVLFIDASGNLGQDNAAFFWNITADELLLGTNTTLDSRLGLSLSALKTNGLYIDGATNDYTGEAAQAYVIRATRDIGDNDGNPVSMTMVSGVLVNSYSASGSQTITNLGVIGDITVAGVTVEGTENNYGLRSVVARSGTIVSAGTLTLNNIGVSTALTATHTFNNAGLVITENNIGHNIVISAAAGPGTHGGHTKNSYGLQISVTGAAGAGNSVYGIYIPTITGPDAALSHGIHVIPDVDNYFRGDLGINTTTYSGQISQVIDTAVRTGYFLQGAVSQSGDYISVVTSGSANVFTVSPNATAADPTLRVRTLFDSADSVNARFTGPDRATAANFDRFSWEFYLDDSNEVQQHFAEIEFVAQAVNSAGRFGGMFFYTEVNSSNINILSLGQSAAGGVGFLVNASKIDMDTRFNTVVTTGTLSIDGGLDAIQITPTTTRASAAGATWDGFDIEASTATITGSTNITTATGFNLVNISRPTASAGTALTITNAATVYIANSPLGAGAGPATITNPYSLWIDDGASRFDGSLNTTPVTNAQLTADQNDYAIGAGSSFRLNSDAQRTITGMTGGTDGKMLTIRNFGSFNIVLANQSGSSAAANRIITGTGADLVISPDRAVLLVYFSTDSKWQVIA